MVILWLASPPMLLLQSSFSTLYTFLHNPLCLQLSAISTTIHTLWHWSLHMLCSHLSEASKDPVLSLRYSAVCLICLLWWSYGGFIGCSAHGDLDDPHACPDMCHDIIAHDASAFCGNTMPSALNGGSIPNYPFYLVLKQLLKVDILDSEPEKMLIILKTFSFHSWRSALKLEKDKLLIHSQRTCKTSADEAKAKFLKPGC